MNIEVTTDVGASDSELAALDAAFRRVGFEVRAEASERTRAAEPLPWVVYIVLGAPLAAFFHTLASEAAKDAYQPLKQWVKDVFAARGGSPAHLSVEDVEGSRVSVGSNLPEEALEALARLDWSQFPSGGDLHWSESRQEWLDPRETPEAF
jgi:hypothetical protein